MGECDQATSEQILDYFYESGGNFIDTSNNYRKLYSHMNLLFLVYEDREPRS
jgi:aryl-alcohol dehydrogenase-like predicted oxidoreductase